MGLKLTLILLIMCVLPNLPFQDQMLAQKKLALTPPMGWNSFDSYGVYLFEKAAFDNLEAMASKLKPFGYEYFVIDAGWYGEFELIPGTIFPKEKHAAHLNFNEYGLLQPSKCYFPNGLKPIIDRCHELGLKFGIHLMRGIPREVVRRNLPIQNSKYHAAEIADTNSICIWNPQNYGINMDKPGAQDFYNSLVNQMADWGVDFLKYDDIVPYPNEVDAVTKAISQCGRPIMLSLSPGGFVNTSALGTFKKANMLRVTPDIWDSQTGIDKCFNAWRKWQGKEEPGFWIDMDMIPFGQLQLMAPRPEELPAGTGLEKVKGNKTTEMLSGKGKHRWSELTKDQMYTFITLRAMAASPLMLGGDLPSLDTFSLALITNQNVLACNRNGVMGHLISENDSIEIWRTPEKNSNNGWIGIFNQSEETVTKKIDTSLFDLKQNSKISLFDVWANKPLLKNQEVEIEPNGVVFIRFTTSK